jgi:hypothetical protein
MLLVVYAPAVELDVSRGFTSRVDFAAFTVLSAGLVE